MTQYPDFTSLVRTATVSETLPTGHDPYRYQQRIADEGFPDLIEAPTGSGKTMAATLPYLWRALFHPDPQVRAATPRRLVITLPTRALIEQTGEQIRHWLEQLGLQDEVALHVLMGGQDTRRRQQEWRLNLHRHTILVGTLDMVVSRALLRGYGSYRGTYPIDFALVTNGTQIVVDEIQLAPQATATLRQIAAFQRERGTAEPSGLTVMSATVDARVLDTVDNPWDEQHTSRVTVDEAKEPGSLLRRLHATRILHQLPEAAKPREFAAQILERHLPGSLTLVVLNTVEAAVEAYKALLRLKPTEETLLIHSRFRGTERIDQLRQLRGIQADGGIVIATQAIEAGVDIDARTLITEAAPWSSVVQRAGRCNRAGRLADGDAVLWWRAPAKPEPYASEQVAEAVKVLAEAEGSLVTSRQLLELGEDIPGEDLTLRFLRRRDFEQLFDTTPDLSGADTDIGVYIRPDQDLDVQVAWVPDGSVVDGQSRQPVQGRIVQLPPGRLRCPVSIPRLTQLVKQDHVTAWVYRPQEDRWVPARTARLRPQDVVLVESSSGGYDERLGFDPKSKIPVDPKLSAEELHEVNVPEGPTAAQDPGARDASPTPGWVTLEQHLTDTGAQATSLAEAMTPALPAPVLRAAVVAAALHDLGKAHADWQRALADANQDTPPPDPEARYAKSPGSGALRVMRTIEITSHDEGTRLRTEARPGFRHELVTVFMLRSAAGRELMSSLGVAPEDQPLVLYLVGAHHGHLRISARDPHFDGRDGRTLMGCRDGDPTPAITLHGHDIPSSAMNLSLFHTGGEDAWTRQALALRDRLGPFRLAYLESLVRMADWRASAGMPLTGGRR